MRCESRLTASALVTLTRTSGPGLCTLKRSPAAHSAGDAVTPQVSSAVPCGRPPLSSKTPSSCDSKPACNNYSSSSDPPQTSSAPTIFADFLTFFPMANYSSLSAITQPAVMDIYREHRSQASEKQDADLKELHGISGYDSGHKCEHGHSCRLRLFRSIPWILLATMSLTTVMLVYFTTTTGPLDAGMTSIRPRDFSQIYTNLLQHRMSISLLESLSLNAVS